MLQQATSTATSTCSGCFSFSENFKIAGGRELASRLAGHEVRQPLGIDRRFLAEANADRIAPPLDLRYPDALRQQLQRGVLQQVAHCRRRRAIAVAQLARNIFQLRLRFHSGHALVHAQPLVFFVM